MLRSAIQQALPYSFLLAELKFDPTVTLSGIASVLSFAALLIGGLWLLTYRVKDLNDLKPAIQEIPLIRHDITGIKDDLSEMKGALSVIPTLVATVNSHEKVMEEMKRHYELAMDEMKRRIESLERSKMST